MDLLQAGVEQSAIALWLGHESIKTTQICFDANLYPHKGDVRGEVIEGAFRVLDEFEEVDERAEAMKALPLEHGEEIAFATAALVLRLGEWALEQGGHVLAPVTAEQLV